MEKIEIGYYPIGITGNLAHHKFIIYTDSEGREFQLHGGGSDETGFSNLDEFIKNTSGSAAFGTLEMRSFETTGKTEISDEIPRELMFEGADLGRLFFQMVGMAQGIMEEEAEYNWLTNNSNTLIDRVIQWSGGNAPVLDDTYLSPASLDDTEFNPELYSQLPPVLWGSATYVRHRDILDAIFEQECFPAGTSITLADGSRKAIEDIVTGDVVMSFNAQGALVPAPVTQLLENVTDTWLKLSNGTVVTPGHRFLRPDERFMEIKDIIASDGEIVTKDSSIMTVSAEVINYGTKTSQGNTRNYPLAA